MQISNARHLTGNELFDKNGCAGDLFALINDDDFEAFNDNDASLMSEDWRLCGNCNKNMQRVDSQYRCGLCGKTTGIIEYDDNYNPSVDQYNTTNNSAALRVVGPQSYKFSRALTVSMAPKYSDTQKKETTKQLQRFNAQSKADIFPICILKDTAEMFNNIQKLEVVRRGNGRKGAIAACLSFVCAKEGMSRKPKTIAKFLGIRESDLSRGDKLLRQLHSDGLIEIPIHHNPISDYLMRYFHKLSIDEKYIKVSQRVIDEASDVSKCTPNNAQQSTKCAGVIYALCIQLNLCIDKHSIEKACEISKTTFIKYYEFLVRNRLVLNKIFKEEFKHMNIPPLKKNKKTCRQRKPLKPPKV